MSNHSNRQNKSYNDYIHPIPLLKSCFVEYCLVTARPVQLSVFKNKVILKEYLKKDIVFRRDVEMIGYLQSEIVKVSGK